MSLRLLLIASLLASQPPASNLPPSSFSPLSFALSPSTFSPSVPDLLPPLCPPSLQARAPDECPDLGPGGYIQRLRAAGLPYPLPELYVEPLLPYLGLTPDAYARIITATAPVYRHPMEALAGLPPLRRFETGFVYASLEGKVSLPGGTFYQINRGEYMRADDLQETRPSTFQGQFFTAPPAAPVGWVIAHVQPSAEPGLAPDPAAAFAGRYQAIQAYDVRRVGDWNWYLIGPGQWVEQRALALVQPAPPPGAPPDVIAVDTYEQTLGVYQAGQLVYATLVSSGSRYFPTRPGTFRVWARLTHGKMSGAYRDDRSDYYFLEDVPWILYYDGDRALHGAYWHDNFGIRSSHGCVNLAPRDARWLYEHTQVGATVVIFSSGG